MEKGKQSNPNSYVESYLPYLLAKASHLVSQGFHQELKQYGISVSTWRILCSISDVERSVGELAKIVLYNQSTLSKALDRLEIDSLIKRSRYSENRRTVNISITSKGKAIVNKVIPLAEAHEQFVSAHIGIEQQQQLKDFLQGIIDKVGE